MPGNSSLSRTNTPANKFQIPVELRVSDQPAYDGAFASMKERFAAEMRRLDEEMAKFSKALLQLTGQTTKVLAGMTSSARENPATGWDVITSSPLIEGQGADKMLKLQFDLSEYEPNEVSVSILNDVLIVSASHQENTDDNSTFTEFNREFVLPAGTDPESVGSSLSKDGVLTVRVPLHIEPPDAVKAQTTLALDDSEDHLSADSKD